MLGGGARAVGHANQRSASVSVGAAALLRGSAGDALSARSMHAFIPSSAWAHCARRSAASARGPGGLPGSRTARRLQGRVRVVVA